MLSRTKPMMELSPSIQISRRTLVRQVVARTGSLLVSPGQRAASILAQEPTSTSGQLVPLNRFSRMVQEWFVEQVRAAEEKIKDRLAALKTKEDAEAYVRSVQQRIRQSFGPEPERTPPNPRITGIVERDTYRIEKVIFDSRPDFPVTANLYVPTGRKLPLPGLVGSCGNSATGNA